MTYSTSFQAGVILYSIKPTDEELFCNLADQGLLSPRIKLSLRDIAYVFFDMCMRTILNF